MPNRLALESSPYLVQHADNPVDWHPWGAGAWELARKEDRPVLLSIGYSSCHWCHVMEKESFADPETAALMNELFVNVKVDREERPDVDQIYMRALQAMTGSGGWPLTAFLTPTGEPFYCGTYFPPRPAPGRPAFGQILVAAAQAYRDRPDEVIQAGRRIVKAMARDLGAPGSLGAGGAMSRPGASGGENATASLVRRALDEACLELSRRFDEVHGGFGGAPKFPPSLTVELLLRHHLRTGEDRPVEMVVRSLRRMASGGMHDQLGGGFHRYAVDNRWLVPHFEKMLYDNALLALAYLDAYRVTDDRPLGDVAVRTLDYMASDLRSAEGAFHTARDADSEGEEGTYYVWRPAEIGALLGEDDYRLLARVYGLDDPSEFEGGNVLHLRRSPEAVAREEGVPLAELLELLSAARAKLLGARSRREAPFRDEKVVTAWAALAVRAFAEAGATLARPDYVEIASGSAGFLWRELRPQGTLVRSWMRGRTGAPAFLEDFAALGNALLSVHSATLDPVWLDRAAELVEEMLDRFGEADEPGLFHDTSMDGEDLVVRPRDPLDNATPSGNSLAVELLVRTSGFLGAEAYLLRAMAVLERLGPALLRYGPAFGRMLSAADRALADPVEVMVASRGRSGGPAQDELTLIQAAFRVPRRNLVVTAAQGADSRPDRPFAGGGMVGGAPTAYLCDGGACGPPIVDAAALRQELEEGRGVTE